MSWGQCNCITAHLVAAIVCAWFCRVKRFYRKQSVYIIVIVDNNNKIKSNINTSGKLAGHWNKNYYLFNIENKLFNFKIQLFILFQLYNTQFVCCKGQYMMIVAVNENVHLGDNKIAYLLFFDFVSYCIRRFTFWNYKWRMFTPGS